MTIRETADDLRRAIRTAVADVLSDDPPTRDPSTIADVALEAVASGPRWYPGWLLRARETRRYAVRCAAESASIT